MPIQSSLIEKIPTFVDDETAASHTRRMAKPAAGEIRSTSATVDPARRLTIAPEALADDRCGRIKGDDEDKQREGEQESEREGDESGAFDESDGADDREMKAQRTAITIAQEAFGGVGRVVENAVQVPGAFVGDSGREEQVGDDQQAYKREDGDEGDEGDEGEEGESSDDERWESAEENEYDWEAEAQKPPKTKGLQETPYSVWFRFRQMVWEKRDGRWHGEWRWSKWEKESKWEKRVEDDRERAIRAWNFAGPPQEVLLLAIECLVGRRGPVTLEYSIAMSRVHGLHNLALVCRAWYNLVAPALYSRLEVRDEILGYPLRKCLAQHAGVIRVHSIRPIITSTRLMQSAPHPSPAVWLYWKGPRQEEAREAAYHPSHVVVYTQLHRSYSNVVSLELWYCTFLSSSDLMRLLASFSALESVHLWSISVTHISHSVIQQGHSSTGIIRHIGVDNRCTPPQLPFLTRCWTCKPSNQQTSPFHGLSLVEQQLAARLLGLMNRPDYNSWYHLDAMDMDGVKWVAWMDMFSLHIEFHALQHNSLRPAAARVQHCLLRVHDHEGMQELMASLTIIGDALTRFAHLGSVVLETGDNVTPDEILPLLELLRKVCRVEVQHRTCDEGHKLALQAKKSPSRSTSAGLLSPIWCLKERDLQWYNWLSKDYWTSLKDEDKQGWDPSRPRTATQAAVASG